MEIGPYRGGGVGKRLITMLLAISVTLGGQTDDGQTGQFVLSLVHPPLPHHPRPLSRQRSCGEYQRAEGGTAALQRMLFSPSLALHL